MSFHPEVVEAVRKRVNEASITLRAQNRIPNTFVDRINRDLSKALLGGSPANTSLAATRYVSVEGVQGNVSVTFLYAGLDAFVSHYPPLQVADIEELMRPGVVITTVGSSTALGIKEAFEAREVEGVFAVFTDPQFSAAIPKATVLLSEGMSFGLSNASTTVPMPLLETDVNWLTSAYKLVSLGKIAGALRIMYWGIEDLFATRNFLLLNHTLTTVDLALLTPEVMTGLIRSTFRGRLVLPAWTSLLKKIKVEMQRRNVVQWERLLVGLD